MTEVLGIDTMEQALRDDGWRIGLFFALQAGIGSIEANISLPPERSSARRA